jgi:hypothetical protein
VKGSRPIRIANFSGTLGDWLGAFAAAVHGEPVDVLIGDYLAEMTMAAVASARSGASGNPALSDFYVAVFLKQLFPELETIAARGLKIVVNAGAFNPAGMADAIREEISRRDLPLRVAHVAGDDVLPRLAALAGDGQLRHLDTGLPPGPLLEQFAAANAYLGGWGIAAALEAGTDIVICGRVSDASLVAGPAAWWHGWRPDDWDRIAGAVAAGHIIECGPQAMGGNFSGFAALDPALRLGFPIAEIAEDGSSIITKREDEGGSVTVDTVTAQLLYEIQGPDYLNPDVVLHVDTIRLTQAGPSRVAVSGVRGSAAPATSKVGCFYASGWKALMWGFATGTEIDAKLGWFDRQMRAIADTLPLDDYRFEPLGRPADNPTSQAEATVAIRIAAAAAEPGPLRELTAGFTSLGLGGIPGFHVDLAGSPVRRIDYWPGLMPQADIRQEIVLDDGRALTVAAPPCEPFQPSPRRSEALLSPVPGGATRRVPLADLVHARTGDKGGDASLGLWPRDPRAWEWLRATLDEAYIGRLLGLRQDVRVKRHELANVHGLLFILHGYFGASGSGNIGLDQIGKALGEFLRAKLVDVPVDLLDEPHPAMETAA